MLWKMSIHYLVLYLKSVRACFLDHYHHDACVEGKYIYLQIKYIFLITNNHSIQWLLFKDVWIFWFLFSFVNVYIFLAIKNNHFHPHQDNVTKLLNWFTNIYSLASEISIAILSRIDDDNDNDDIVNDCHSSCIVFSYNDHHFPFSTLLSSPLFIIGLKRWRNFLFKNVNFLFYGITKKRALKLPFF